MQLYIHLSPFILFVLFIFYRVYVLYYSSSRVRIIEPKITNFREGYESLKNCLNQGFPDDFCLRSPLQACVTNCPVGTFQEKKFNVVPM